MLVGPAELVITIPLPKNRVVSNPRLGWLPQTWARHLQFISDHLLFMKSWENLRYPKQSREFAQVDCAYPLPSPLPLPGASSFQSKASKLSV